MYRRWRRGGDPFAPPGTEVDARLRRGDPAADGDGDDGPSASTQKKSERHERKAFTTRAALSARIEDVGTVHAVRSA